MNNLRTDSSNSSFIPLMMQSTLRLTSPAFQHEGLIPSLHTCDDRNISPTLEIAGVPEGAVSLVLIMDDPDVPRDRRPDGMFDHWVVSDIPPSTRVIPEGTEPAGVPGSGTMGHRGYRGPCPPDCEHRYFFKLYALDTLFCLPEGSTKAEVEAVMAGHILAETVLMGRYDRR